MDNIKQRIDNLSSPDRGDQFDLALGFDWNPSLEKWQPTFMQSSMTLNEIDRFSLSGILDILAATLNDLDLPHP